MQFPLQFKTVLTQILNKIKLTINCPRRDFAQKAKSLGGTLVTRAYIKGKYLELKYTVIPSI